MSPTIDAVNTPAAATGTTASLTSSSFSPAAGSVIVLLWGANHPTPTVDVSISSVTNTGGAVIWQRRARKNANASSDGGAGTAGGAEIWTGTAPGGAITVTANGVASGAGTEKSLAPIVLTGADTVNLTNIAAAFSLSGLPSVTVTGCAAGSFVFAVSSDWQALGAGTAGSAQTIISEFHTPSQMTMHWWRTTSVLAGAGSQTMNLTAPAGEQYNIVAIEIRDAGSAAADQSGPPQQRIPPHLLLQLAAQRQRLYDFGSATTVSAENGRTAAAASATGTAVKRAFQTGTAAVAGAAAGTGQKVAAKTGTAAAAATAAGAGKKAATETGTAAAAAVGQAAAAKVAAAAGRTVAAVSSNRLGTDTRPQTGQAAVAARAAGAGQRIAATAGQAVIASRAAATAGARRAQAGAARATAATAGTARKTSPAAGAARAVAVAAGTARKRAAAAGRAVAAAAAGYTAAPSTAVGLAGEAHGPDAFPTGTVAHTTESLTGARTGGIEGPGAVSQNIVGLAGTIG